MDSAPLIRSLQPADVDYLHGLVAEQGWGVTWEELARLVSYEPQGCFVADYDDIPAGVVTSTSYGALGWIGFLIVKPHARGRGIGEQLMRAAMRHLHSTGVEAIRLDATEAGEPLYRKLGFVAEERSLRFRRPPSDAPSAPPADAPSAHSADAPSAPSAKAPSAPAANASSAHPTRASCDSPPEADLRVTRAQPPDHEQIRDLDRIAFGADRSRVLTRVLQACPAFSFVARINAAASRGAVRSGTLDTSLGAGEADPIAGFLLGRTTETSIRLGPWIVRPGPRTDPVAASLLRHALLQTAHRSRDGVFKIGVLESHSASLRLLRAHGFVESHSTLRMRHGRDGPRGTPAAVFAIGCAGKG